MCFSPHNHNHMLFPAGDDLLRRVYGPRSVENVLSEWYGTPPSQNAMALDPWPLPVSPSIFNAMDWANTYLTSIAASTAKPSTTYPSTGLLPKLPELSDETARAVAWAAIARHPLDETARDRYGNEVHWSEHGKMTAHGWHVDHYPIAQCDGGKSVVGNLQALHWRPNVTLGGYLSATAKSA